MIERRGQEQLDTALAHHRVVGLAGVRGGGKSALVRSVMKRLVGAGDELEYLDLERADDREKIGDGRRYFQAIDADLVICDEIDRRPELLTAIWRLIDGKRYRGRFLLTTSAMPAWMAGAGSRAHNAVSGLAPMVEALRRVAWLQVPALTIAEAPVDMHEDLQLRGGLPASLLAESSRQSNRYRREWLIDLLEHRLAVAGRRAPVDSLRRMLAMLARIQGETWNASRLARGLAVSVPTAGRWLDILKGLFLVRAVPALPAATGKRLIKSPRIYIRDVGLVNLLLGIAERRDLLVSPYVAAIWEGWMVEQFIACAPPASSFAHYRTAGGGSIDLLLLAADGSVRRALDFRHGGRRSRR